MSAEPVPTARREVDPLNVLRDAGMSVVETSAECELTADDAAAVSAEYRDGLPAVVVLEALYTSPLDGRLKDRLVWIIGYGPYQSAAHAKAPIRDMQSSLVLDANTGELLDAKSAWFDDVGE